MGFIVKIIHGPYLLVREERATLLDNDFHSM
jgi:hypothetical protein